MMVEIKCAATGCQFNKGGQCASPSIDVDETGNCRTNTSKQQITPDMMQDEMQSVPAAGGAMDMDALIRGLGME